MRFWNDIVLNRSEDTLKMLTSITTTNAWVDVRDAAEGHVAALQAENAGGERVLLCAGKTAE